jgi:hypothetical protein
VKTIDLTIPEPKKTVSQSSAGSLAKGKQILQRAQQAVGGAAKLTAVKDLTQESDVEIQAGPGGMKAKQTNQWIAPGTFRQTQQLPFGKIIAFFDGKGGWLSTPGGRVPCRRRW